MPRDPHPTVGEPSSLPAHGAMRDDAESDASPRRSRARVRSTRTWREGSRTARLWDTGLLGWAAMSIGAGLVASSAVRMLLPGASVGLVASLVLWAALIFPTVLAFRRGKPRGLLRFRAIDVLYALVIGLALRTVQGWFAVAAGDNGALPSFPSLDGQVSSNLIIGAALAPVVIAPVVEELLFRGVVLVSVYRIARRGLEGALLATVASAALFVALHSFEGVTRWDQPVSLALVGIACSALVLATGRIWGAVLVHVVYNGSLVVLAIAGTLLG